MAEPNTDAAKDAAKEAAKIPAGIFNVLTGASLKSVEALNAVAKGGLTFGNVLSSSSAELAKLGTFGGLAGTGLKVFGEYAQESVDAMRNFSKVGAGFSGDAIGMRNSIAQTNMSLDQYGKFLNTNSVLLTAMGGSVSKGATAFNTFSKEFFAKTGDAEKGLGTFGDQLRNLGMNAEEINGVLALEVSARRFNDLASEPGRLAAIESARALAEEMDKTSKLSGKSREEQQKSLIALERDGKYQAAIRLEMMDGNKFAAEGMISAMSKVEKFGPGVQNLVKDITSFGTASKDSLGTLVGLGPAGTQLQNAINMTKTARTEEQKAAAAKAVSDAEMAIQIQLNSRDFTANARNGIKGFQDLANQTTSLTAGMDKIAVEQGLNLNIESDRRKAAQALNAQIKQDQDAAKTTAKPGDADQGKATTQMVIQFESSLQKASAAVNDQFISRLNTEVAPEMNKVMLKLRAMTDQDLSQTVNKMYDEVSGLFKKPAAADPATAVSNAEAIAAARAAAIAKEKQTTDYKNEPNEGRRRQREDNVADKAEKDEKEKQKQRSTPANNPVSSITPGLFTTTPGTVSVVGAVDVNARPMAIGGIVEKPELILAGEAGPEAIFNQSQLENYTAKVMGSAAGAMPKTESPKIDLSGISKSISTSISSVSGGGSTTNRQVQNDSSKAAEKELASVREQMQAERTVLRQKLKDTIGDGSKSGGNAVAKEMRIGDESKAITDKYNAIMEPLQKQIDAGKSLETVREEAKAETIKIIDEQIAITKTGNSTIADVYRNNSKSKLSAAKQDAESLDDMYKDDSKAKLDLAKQRNEALFKAAELAKDVVGTSVKDMSDSVFESMIPKGAKIEDYYEDMNGKLQSHSLDTVAKLEKLAKDSANTIITEEEAIVESRVAIKKTEKQMAAAVAMPKTESPKIDLSGISKSISTIISSVSGGGSTANKRVQTDDSKTAQQELLALEKAQVAERLKAVAQLKEEGVIKGKFASSSDYKNIPQLAALKEKQDGEKAVLSKRVDAGNSMETVREEAKAETIKIIDEQIAITKTGNSTIADVYRNNSKSKLSAAKQDTESLDNMYKDDSKAKLDLAKLNNAALFQEAELAKSVVGTSVKDMSEDMINAMIPKGATIEDYYVDINGKLQSNAADTVAKMEKTAKDSANVVESYSTTISSSSKKIAGDIAGALPKPEELNALMPKPDAISGIFSNLFGNIPKTEELNALMPKPEEISGIFSNLFKTVPKLAATAEQKVDPNQADNDDAEMGAAIRANDVAGKLISAAPVEIDNPEAAMGAGKYSPVKPNATPVAGKDPFARMLDRFMGPMAEPGKALASAEAAKTAITTQNEAAAKADAAREEAKFKQKANQSGASQSQDPKTDKPITGSKESTLSDVVKSLDTLNMQVGQLAGTMSQLPYLMEKSVSATKSLNGNLNARVT